MKKFTLFKKFFFTLLLLLVAGVNSVYGAWSGSGEGIWKDNTWYVLYETGEQSIFTTGSKDYTLSGPGKVLTFTAKRSYTAVGNLVVSDNKGTSLYNSNPSTSYTNYTGNNNCNVDATKITFSFTGSYTRYFKNVKVTMAQYVNAPSVTSLDFGSADINATATSKTVTVAWCNVPAMTYTITGANASLFEVSVTNNSEAGKYNTATFTVNYKHTTAGSHSAMLTIKDSYGNYSKTVSLSGTTNKLTPSITWSPDDAIFNVDDELLATNSNDLVVALSSAGNESYVACSGNTATMLAATSGQITITAHVTGNDIYADKDFTKEITITNLEKQYITWTQDLSRLKTTDATKSVVLNATSSSGLPVSYELQGDKTGLTLTQSGGTWMLTYSATECKNTTIVAMQAGNGTYAPATNVSLPVKVIDPTKVCDVNETLVNSSITLKSSSVTYNIDIPESMKISLNRVKTGLFDVYLFGVDVEFYSGRNGTGTKLYTKSYSTSDINNSISNASISLSGYINAKSVKVVTEASNGYYLTSLTYTKRKYCTLSANSLSFETYPNTTTSAKTFNVNYANYPIALECSNPKFTFSPVEFGDCSEYGTQAISVTYTAGADEGTDNGYIYIKDNTGTTLQTCTLTVSINKVSQSITTTNIQNAYKTTDKVTLTAETNSGEADFTYSAAPAGIASFAGSVMTFSQSGTIAITVSEDGSNIYKPCSATVNNVVVSKDVPHIATLPIGTTVSYLQTLSSCPLSGGSADITLRGVPNSPVAGSFAWTEPAHQVTDPAGSHAYGVTFTPSDGGMYNPNTTGSVTITVNKAAQAISMNNGSVKVSVEGIDAGKADSYLDLNSLIVSQTSDPINNNRVGAVTYEVISANKSNATISGSTFSATVCDTYTVRATKAATAYYNEATYDFTVTVGKRANTIATAGPYTKYVDEEVTNVATVINSDGTIHTSSSDATIAYYDITNNKIVIPNSEAKSFDQTTVTIKIWQDATDCFEGITEANAKTITLTVKKYDNPFACSWGSFAKTVNFDDVVAAQFTTQNSDYAHFAIGIAQTSGPKIAKLVRNDDTHNTITASYTVGQATWHLTQNESYKYKAASADVTLNVQTLSGEECYMFEDKSEHEFSTGITDGSGHYDTPIPVSGPVDKLYFEARKSLLGVSKFIVQYSVDNGSNWRTIAQPELNLVSWDNYGPYDFPNLAANERVSHIRFGAETGATFSKYYRNIQITRTTNILPLDADGNHITTLMMPQNTVGGTTTAQFYLNYSSCDDVIKIVSDNAHFTVDQSEISVDHSKDFNNATITVSYYSEEKGTHTGTITIYTKYQNETFTVTGNTDKKIQTLTWEEGYNENPLSLPVGLVVDNVNYAVSASSGNAVIYTSSDESVIEIIQAGLGFKIVGEGTATLTATQAGNEDWFPVSESKTIHATYKKLQEIVWTQDFIRDIEVGQEIALDAKVYIRNLATGALTYNASQTALISYSCPANTVIALDGENKRITILGYGQTSITASLPTGSDYYEDAAPVTLIVKVRKPSEGCETPWVLDQASTIELFDDNVLGGSAYNFSDWTTPELTSDPILLDPAAGKPDKLSYQHDAEKYSIRAGLILLEMCSGKVVAQQRVNGNWQDITGSEYEQGATLTDWTAGAYTWREVKDLQLDENADAIRFKRFDGGTGHHNFKDIQISILHYLRPTAETVDLGDITIGEDRHATIGIDYSDIKKDLSAAKGNAEDMTYSVGESTVYVDCGSFGHYDLPITLHPTELGPWSNTVIVTDKLTGESVTIIVNANVIPEFIHTYEIAGEWGEQTHWKDDKKPTYKDDVRINADVTIVSDITVNGITIEPNVTVTVNPGVTLTLRDGVSRPRTVYGNLHVKNGAKVNVGTGAFMINDFILDAALGNPGTPASSGQLLDEYAKFIVNGDAYFQLTLGNTNTIGWYDFVVPFNVDVTSGISIVDKDGNVLPARHGEDYVVMRYSEAKRAERGKDWIKFNETMQAGRVYTIAVDANHPEWNTVLFKKNKGAALGAPATYEAECSTGEAIDCGWNGLGNGTLQHMKLSDASVKIQVYDHTNNVFETRDDISGNKFAVGTSFFLQVDEDKKPISFVTAEAALPFLAPARERRTTDEFRLALTAENTDYPSDRLWVSASEEATDEYVVGHDLLKMGTPSEAKVAQMWAKNETNRLCDIEMPLATGKAKCELGLFAPQEANYTLSVEKMPDDAMLYLTYNGRPIWNLTYAPYTFDLTQGFTDGYGLQISVKDAPQVTTGVDNGQWTMDNGQCTKVIIDNKMYIITPQGAMFDATGKKIR